MRALFESMENKKLDAIIKKLSRRQRDEMYEMGIGMAPGGMVTVADPYVGGTRATFRKFYKLGLTTKEDEDLKGPVLLSPLGKSVALRVYALKLDYQKNK